MPKIQMVLLDTIFRIKRFDKINILKVSAICQFDENGDKSCYSWVQTLM